MVIEEVLKVMTPDLYQRFRRAIELGKWPDGKPLSQDQMNTCIQSVIAYEAKHLPPEERTGYIPPKTDACEPEESSGVDDIQPLNWQ